MDDKEEDEDSDNSIASIEEENPYQIKDYGVLCVDWCPVSTEDIDPDDEMWSLQIHESTIAGSVSFYNKIMMILILIYESFYLFK